MKRIPRVPMVIVGGIAGPVNCVGINHKKSSFWRVVSTPPGTQKVEEEGQPGASRAMTSEG
jgi:hypothetical protein